MATSERMGDGGAVAGGGVARVVRLLRETTERVGLLAECPDDEIYARELADSQDDLRAAAAAVAELIAADRLLDKTQAAYDRASAGRMRNDLWADVLAARQRRAAALSNIEGGKA